MYYLRTRPAANPIQFTVDKKRLAASRALNQTNGNISMKSVNANSTINQSIVENSELNEQAHFSIDEETDPQPAANSSVVDLEQQMAAMVCSIDNKDACLMCGS